MRSSRYVMVFFAIFVFISLSYQISYADTGPKPTLEITVTNLTDSNYYLDLLGSADKYNYFDATDGNDAYNNMHDQPIYKYDKDGWKAIHMRTWVLNGKLKGDPAERDKNGNTISMRHSFGYVGVPKEFKIIIQKSDGTLLISDIIQTKYFNAYVSYDMKNNKVLSVHGNILNSKVKFDYRFFLDFIFRIVLTLLIEILIAILFFFRQKKQIYTIACVNLVTQSLLTIALIFDYPLLHMMPFNTGYFAVLMIGEVFVFLIEYLAYLKIFGLAEKRRILIYTLLANLTSLIAGFMIF